MWPASAKAFAEAMSGNGTQLYNWIIPPSGISHENDVARLAVTCLDSPPPTSMKDFPSAEDLAEEGLKTLREVSPHFGMSTGMYEPDGGCQYWPAKGPERFTGPWNATLDIPMLIISNTVSILHFVEWHSLIPSIRLIRKHPSVIGCSVHLSFLSVTPISSGLLINSLMPDSSVLVIQESPGVIYIHHSISLSNYSSCI